MPTEKGIKAFNIISPVRRARVGHRLKFRKNGSQEARVWVGDGNAILEIKNFLKIKSTQLVPCADRYLEPKRSLRIFFRKLFLNQSSKGSTILNHRLYICNIYYIIYIYKECRIVLSLLLHILWYQCSYCYFVDVVDIRKVPN